MSKFFIKYSFVKRLNLIDSQNRTRTEGNSMVDLDLVRSDVIDIRLAVTNHVALAHFLATDEVDNLTIDFMIEVPEEP